MIQKAVPSQSVEEIRKHLERVTPGPWVASKSKWAEGSHGGKKTDKGKERGGRLPLVARFYSGEENRENDWEVYPRSEGMQDLAIPAGQAKENAEFASKSVEYVLWLLSEVDRLGARCDMLEKKNGVLEKIARDRKAT